MGEYLSNYLCQMCRHVYDQSRKLWVPEDDMDSDKIGTGGIYSSGCLDEMLRMYSGVFDDCINKKLVATVGIKLKEFSEQGITPCPGKD